MPSPAPSWSRQVDADLEHGGPAALRLLAFPHGALAAGERSSRHLSFGEQCSAVNRDESLGSRSQTSAC